MKKLSEVEEAKALLTEGQDWSIWRWLTEKRKVRAVADRGTAALDELEKQVKAGWSEELKNSYAELAVPEAVDDDPFAAAERQFMQQQARPIPESVKAVARRVKEADDEAYRARMTAEATFDQAERRLSSSLAKRGAQEAIEAYALRYKAIREAKAARAACARSA
jgi:hypothetical protein